MRDEKQRLFIELDNLIPIFHGMLDRGRAQARAGVVDEYVEPSEHLDRFLDDFGPVGLVVKVELHGRKAHAVCFGKRFKLGRVMRVIRGEQARARLH
ncbi:hypothetical protein SDC9_120449 [bioreactor metagenome]|uniref:Uncharacterized protein n=1 Tax=bioreactor metagenome TaxID=1076179 RepID=A0A645C743_9ZZZZ